MFCVWYWWLAFLRAPCCSTSPVCTTQDSGAPVEYQTKVQYETVANHSLIHQHICFRVTPQCSRRPNVVVTRSLVTLAATSSSRVSIIVKTSSLLVNQLITQVARWYQHHITKCPIHVHMHHVQVQHSKQTNHQHIYCTCRRKLCHMVLLEIYRQHINSKHKVTHLRYN